LGLLAMPFGFEAYPLFVMGQGIEFIHWISVHFQSLSSGFSNIGQLEATTMCVVFLLMMITALMKTKLRFIPLVIALLLLWVAPVSNKPNILISEDGKTIAVVQQNGMLAVSGARAGKFEIKVWRQALGLHEEKPKLTSKQSAHMNAFKCDHFGCFYEAPHLTVAHIRHPSAFYEDCRRADIIVSELSAPPFCDKRAIVIDRSALKARGAHAIYLKTQKKGEKLSLNFDLQYAIPTIKRPWHAHYAN